MRIDKAWHQKATDVSNRHIRWRKVRSDCGDSAVVSNIDCSVWNELAAAEDVVPNQALCSICHVLPNVLIVAEIS